MTKRALAIQGFVAELQKLALDGTPFRMALNNGNKTMTAAEARRLLTESEQVLQGHLVNIVERNEEQAEALMTDLGLKTF